MIVERKEVEELVVGEVYADISSNGVSPTFLEFLGGENFKYVAGDDTYGRGVTDFHSPFPLAWYYPTEEDVEEYKLTKVVKPFECGVSKSGDQYVVWFGKGCQKFELAPFDSFERAEFYVEQLKACFV